MAALQNLLPAPELGQLYASFHTLKDNIEDWSVHEKIHFTVPTKDVSRVIYKCKNNACDWRLRANKQHDEYYMLSIPALHFCPPGLLQHTNVGSSDIVHDTYTLHGQHMFNISLIVLLYSLVKLLVTKLRKN